jgi:hypothetical protein
MGQEGGAAGTWLRWVDVARQVIGIIGAVFILVMFASYLRELTDKLGTLSDAHWARALFLFGSVQSLAFAAAGFFFGAEVKRHEAASARRDAAVVTKKAEELAKGIAGIADDLEGEADEARAAEEGRDTGAAAAAHWTRQRRITEKAADLRAQAKALFPG